MHEPCPHPSEHCRTLFPATDYISGDAFEIVRCAQCDAVMTRPVPRAEELGRYYPKVYYRSSDGTRFPGAVEFLQRLLYASRARQVERMLGGRAGRVLDVGCGPGWLLKAFERRGWEAKGTELSVEAAAFAREGLGLDVESRELEDLAFPEDSFDAVILWHVLEHLPAPEAVLREVARILKPGGVLFLGVPNWGSPESQSSGPAWFQLDVPRHLNHFTAERLEGLLEANGFHLRRRRFLAPEFDFFSFVQTALNRLGLPHNLLYTMLRRGDGKAVGGSPLRWLQAAATLALTPFLGLLALPAVLSATLLEEGGSMTLHAVKRK